MSGCRYFLYYNTIEFVTIHSLKLGILHRFFQITVLLYIAIYSLWLSKGYQEYTQVSGFIYTKVKGSGYTNTTNGTVVYDSTDLVMPPLESNAIFVTTSFISTKQQRGICDSTIPCKQDTDCKENMTPNGLILPQCNIKNTTGHCLIEGWCPLEKDDLNHTVPLKGLENTTVFLRSSASYGHFGIILSDSNNATLGRNLFYLKDMLPGGETIDNCTFTGCIVSVRIDWTCDFDLTMNCTPTFSYKSIQGGFNFRTIQDFKNDTRILQKLYGIRFLLHLTGVGGRFSVFQTVITVGSGVALFAVGTVMVDFLIFIVYKRSANFHTKKWQHYEPIPDPINEYKRE